MIGRRGSGWRLPASSVACVFAVLLALVTAGGASATQPEPARGGCGLYPQGGGVYLSPITKRDHVSCKTAKRVASEVFDEFGENVLCKGKTEYRRWNIKHRGIPQALSGRFSSSGRRFDISSQGSC